MQQAGSGITVVVDDERRSEVTPVRIMLCMIVKNEAKIIGRCLEAALPHIGAASICDTGSTDDTRAVIATTLDASDISYRIHRHDWVNFGLNRTRSFQAARTLASDLGWDLQRSWALFLDADMVLEAGAAFDAQALDADAYIVRQGGDTFFYYNTRLVRLALDWRCIGATHEYWAAEGTGRGERLDSLRIHDIGDGGAKADKFERDIRLLETELREQPDNVRSMFYLAQSYYDVGRYADAHAMYLKRAVAGGWEEEAWFAAHKAGMASIQGGEWERGIGELLAAWQRRPWRAEPLYELAKAARLRGESALAMLAAERALRIPAPEDETLFIDRFAHSDGPLEEVSISAWYTGQHHLGIEATDALLHSPTAPEGTRILAGNNATYYARPLPAAFSRRIEPPEHVLDPYYTASTGTIVATDDGYAMINRLVNYDQQFGVHWYSRDPSGQIRTKNAWITLDRDLQPTSYAAIDHSLLERVSAHAPESLRVYGLEDNRLVRWRDAWWFTAGCWHFDPEQRPSMALGRLDESGTQIEHIVPLHYAERNHVEKNWLPFEHEGRLLILHASGPPVVLEPDPETGVCQVVHRGGTHLRFDRYRGSAAPIPWGSGYLYSIHEVAFINEKRVYRHRLVEMDSAFCIRRVSHPFSFRDTGVEYSCGHCLSHDGTMLVIAHSWEEQQSWLTGVSVEQVERMLVPVDDLSPTLSMLARLHTPGLQVGAQPAPGSDTRPYATPANTPHLPAAPSVAALYRHAVVTSGDISEHLPTLMRLGKMVEHITEFGTRAGLSTAALLKAEPRRLIAYDIERLPEVDTLEAAAQRAGLDFSFRLEDVLQATIEPTDLLFIDTLHTYDQLHAELERHAAQVRTFIALHDTTTFGERGELPGSNGLWPAVVEFLDAHPEWKLIDRWTNNNGFTLLMRVEAHLAPTCGDQ